MNKVTWFHRNLLLYVPVFFVVTTLVLFLSLFAMNQMFLKSAKRVNETTASHLLQQIDFSLQTIDRMVIKEMENDKFVQFFYANSESNTFYAVHEPSVLLNDIITRNDMIDSIYLFRKADNIVLSQSSLFPLEQFGDEDYVNRILNNPLEGNSWSNKRTYKEFPAFTNTRSVVSLVRKMPLFSGGYGFVVINVKGDYFEQIVRNTSSANSYIRLYDQHQDSLTSNDIDRTKPGKTSVAKQSEYTGWTIENGIYNEGFFAIFNQASIVFFLVEVLLVIFGIAWIVYVTRRNYKPIEAIYSKIKTISNQITPFNKANDEITYIENAVVKLIEKSSDLITQTQENAHLKKAALFDELLLGEGGDEQKWTSEMVKIGFALPYHAITVSVVEIDRYTDFVKKYNARDQTLLKFALSSALDEICADHGVEIWAEWTSNHQMCVILLTPTSIQHHEPALVEILEVLRKWIQSYLRFTVTIAVGKSVKLLSELHQSFAGTSQALQYKTSLGHDRIIGYWDIQHSPQGDAFRHLQDIRLTAESFRRTDNWREELQRIFTEVRCSIYTKDEINHLLNFFIFTIDQEFSQFSQEIYGVWKDAKANLYAILEETETMDEIEDGFVGVLTSAAEEIHLLRDKRDQNKLIHDIKQYIQESYHDSNLSLQHLSDLFGIQIKTLSRLFKEECGEKFVDYVAYVRIENAKRLLEETDLSIREIGERSGYVHSFSFIRVFKKEVGSTPGDYRKKLES
ncbi:MAG: hypothetical protein K0Q73_3106 [Paenibacillus sp.]|nr:hypothetical protein [Paenibacillus sp.]